MRKEKQTDRDKHRHDMFFSAKTGAVRSVFANRKPKIPKRTKPITPVETRIVRKPLCKSLL